MGYSNYAGGHLLSQCQSGGAYFVFVLLSLCGFGSLHFSTLGPCSGAARSLALLSPSLSSSPPGDDDRSSWRWKVSIHRL